MKSRIILTSIILALVFVGNSCQKEVIQSIEVEKPTTLQTRSIVPEEFDWETADWMPTPPGQAQIPVPWSGQGNISGFYGPDIVYDFKYVDGWRLMYSTFRDNGEELSNPYFILYNVYRGTMRIYFYLTDTYIGASTYLKDALTFSSSIGFDSNILNYLPGHIIDTSTDVNTYSQLQPKMINGGSPLASKRWYMIEYELAYDPGLSNFNSNQAYLYWTLDYVNVTEVKLNGQETSEIIGTIGGSDSFWSDAVGSTAKGALSVLGVDFLNSVSERNEQNSIGLTDTLITGLINGLNSVVNSLGAGLPDFAFSLLNSIFGGSTSTAGTAVSLKMSTDVQLEGALNSQGALPSTPVDIKIPGTNILPDASGFIPLYDEPLGVFYWNGANVNVNIVEYITVTRLEDDIMGTGTYNVYTSRAVPGQQHYEEYIVINPAVSAIANVSIVSVEPLAVLNSGAVLDFPLTGTIYENPYEGDDPIEEISKVALQVVLKVDPYNGAPESYIIKTFYADSYTWSKQYIR